MERQVVIIEVEDGFDEDELAEYTQFDPELIETIEIAKERLLLEGIKFHQCYNILITDQGVAYCALYGDYLKTRLLDEPEDCLFAELQDFYPFSLN
jgi:hypothetical protein